MGCAEPLQLAKNKLAAKVISCLHPSNSKKCPKRKNSVPWKIFGRISQLVVKNFLLHNGTPMF